MGRKFGMRAAIVLCELANIEMQKNSRRGDYEENSNFARQPCSRTIPAAPDESHLQQFFS